MIVSLALGLWTLLLWFMAWCSDPGVITWWDDTDTKNGSRLEYGSFSEDE